MKITVSLSPEKLTLDVSQNSKIIKLFFYSPSFAIVVMDFFKHGLRMHGGSNSAHFGQLFGIFLKNIHCP